MEYSPHFLNQTAKDYDLHYEQVEEIALKANSDKEFYEMLEITIRE